MPRLRTAPAAIALLGLLLLAGCDGSDGNTINILPPPPPEPEFLPIASPTVSDPPAAPPTVLLTTTFDLAEVGYRQREFFFEGEANRFRNVNEFQADGRWEAEPAGTAPYRSRLIVYRPEDPAAFSGTVFVEWLNVTSGFDIAPSWGTGHVELLRGGHAWVGVTAQRVGIEGSENSIAPLHLKAANGDRYGNLEHPGDSYSYDIFSQVAQALREPGPVDLLEGLAATQLIAMGESQSAGRLLTYVNAIHPLYNAYDGYMIHSRGDGSPALAQEPEAAVPTPETVRIRDDLNVPVMNFQTETDVVLLGAAADRQPDSDSFRLWEVAGSAHGDYYTFVGGRSDTGADPLAPVVVEEDTILGFLRCDRPMNAGSMPWVFKAALRALDAWAAGGPPPPEAPRLTLTDAGALARDAFGNAVGGIRSPYVDAPAATLTGENNGGAALCFLFGTTELFDAATMASLYVDREGYRGAVNDAAEAAVEAGFLLQEDANRIIGAAGLQWDNAPAE
ncbi:MAG TPA: alpha/beta hydrolase domain-containing protein [Pseudohaliea sp.]|nr:alpha/beta hydrolase domain-containing protein [Pseudohaliea sp.]